MDIYHYFLSQMTGLSSFSPILLYLLQCHAFGFGNIEISPYDCGKSYYRIKPKSTCRIPQVFSVQINFSTFYSERLHYFEECKRYHCIEHPNRSRAQRGTETSYFLRKYFRNNEPTERADTDRIKIDVDEHENNRQPIAHLSEIRKMSKTDTE